jgi:hypothetical protein
MEGLPRNEVRMITGALGIADESSPNYGRMKRHSTAAEAKGCSEDL